MEVNKLIGENKYNDALSECVRTNQNHLGLLLSKMLNMHTSDRFTMLKSQLIMNVNGFKTEEKTIENYVNIVEENNPKLLEELPSLEELPELSPLEEVKNEKTIKVKLLCNWASDEFIRENYKKFTKGNYRWNNIEFVLDDKADYFVVINCPPINAFVEPKKTIVFRMEPYMDKNKIMWGNWATPPKDVFYKVCYHETDYNNNEWHLGKTYHELKEMKIEKKHDIVSAVLSDKYNDPGHIKRVDFVKFLEKKDFPVHVYGSNKWKYKDYKGSLPPHCKDDALFPYKYTFNVENNSIKNYYTEKIIDGILSECLVFYSGCYNVREFLHPKSFVYLELSNFEKDFQTVQNAIKNNLWEERLPYIRQSKRKILEYLQVCPRIERIIKKREDEKYEETEV